MGRGAKKQGAEFQACAVGETRGAEKVHARRSGADRALCGRVVAGKQPKRDAPCTCWACTRRMPRDTERPPAPALALQPVTALRSSRSHYAVRNSLSLATEKTLCGRAVDGMLAIGPAPIDCKLCASRAKGAA